MYKIRCKVCKDAETIIHLDSYKLNLCAGCFDDFVIRRVKKGIKDFHMFGRDHRILVAVSGGKDSLALWDILLRLGYQADGFYIDLGISDYSAESRRMCEVFASARDARLHVHAIPETFGGNGVRELARLVRRKSCALCGTVKRHAMNRVALEHGYDVLATGHNLDDEVTVLLGNVLHWQIDYLGRQYPALPEEGGLKRKVKPLIYLGEKEMAAYTVMNGIDYIYEECPLAQGATSLFHKEVLNLLEQRSRGTKLSFLKGFFAERDRFESPREPVELAPCPTCGTPTTAGTCAWCRLKERVLGTVEESDAT